MAESTASPETPVPSEKPTEAPAGLNWRSPRAVLRYLLSLDDTPHRIALGAAIGMFIALTPTFGVQTLMAIATYYLCLPFLRFNFKAAVVMVYVSNPLTMLPIFWFEYSVGRIFVGGDVTRDQLAAVVEEKGDAEGWEAVWALAAELGWTMLVGSLVVCVVASLLTYPAMRWLLAAFRGLKRKDAADVAAPGPTVLVSADRETIGRGSDAARTTGAGAAKSQAT